MSELPPEIDTFRPHPARMYDYGIGGKNHFAADREVAEKIFAAWPGGRTSGRENRSFLGRAVRYLVAEAGIRQFLDIGTGIPAQMRDSADFARLAFHGLELVPPGVVPVSEWKPDTPGPRPSLAEVSTYGGVARKP